MMKNSLKVLAIAALLLNLFSCKQEIVIGDEENLRASHDKGFDPNYDLVFEENKVHRIDIVMTSDDWGDMQDDLADKVSSGGGPGGGNFDSENPSYFPCDLYYNGEVWKDVGVRYKGNSSLRARSGKLPLRLVFDEYEDDNPEIYNQRFYGFKELSLSSNYNDASLMREKTAADLFRSFGVPAVRSAFYEIYIDTGNGPEYFGVYTMLEVVFNTFLEDYFGTESGNCYKPENDGAAWASRSFNLEDFEAKTNEETTTKADIQEMFDILHSGDRTSDVESWKIALESVFDVDGFLRYLAANNTLQNWDTYGRMTHNYYLYHDPADGLIKWIVWDNNEAFQNGKQGGSLSFAMTEIGTDWPLIDYIIGVPAYEARYKELIREFIDGPFSAANLGAIYDAQQTLLSTSAANERSGYSYVNGQFNSAVNSLKSHNTSRIAAAEAYLE